MRRRIEPRRPQRQRRGDHRATLDGRAHPEPPAEGFHPVGETLQPGAPREVRAADTVVGDRDNDLVTAAPQADRHRRRVGVLGHVGQRLRRHEVRRELHRLGQPRPVVREHRRRHGARPASASSATSRPCSSAAGWIPLASSRSSSSDRASSSLAELTSCSASFGSRWISRRISESCSASVTSRCWAPSCRLRSIRRRSASAAATMARGKPAARRAAPSPRRAARGSPADPGRHPDRLDELGSSSSDRS